VYNPLKFDLNVLKHQLKIIDIPSVPLSEIFFRKQQEIMLKLRLLEAHKDSDYKLFTQISQELYGAVSEDDFTRTKELLAKKIHLEEEESMSEEEIRSNIKKFNHIYNIKLKFKVSETAARFSVK